ncbi:MAG: cobalt ECF transporter T component CbiQ [Ilumatobacteraceae bacterium]
MHLSDVGPLHRFAPQCKLVGAILFVFAVVSTPREQIWAFALQASLLATVAVAARVPIWFVVRRLTIELPFIAFAFLLPIVGASPRVDVLGLHLSRPGLWAAWNIVIKGTLGVATTTVLAATTPVPHILTGLERLRMPRLLVGVMSFMIRYGDVVGDEMKRMRIARESRGYNPRWIWQATALTQSTGALFIRSYERGERVYLAMEARGYNGSMPARESAATRSQWATCLLLPALASAVSCAAWLSR